MPERPIASTNPLSFSTTNGNHLMIPVSALYFDDAGNLKADRWPLYTANQTTVDAFLGRLRAAGALQAGPEPPVKPALKATAVTKGASGVVVEIEFSNVTANTATPASSTADVTVTETNTFTAIEVGKLVDTMGSTASNGSRPGLVFVSSAGVPTLPKDGTYAFAAPAAGQPVEANIDEEPGPGTAFTLKARAVDPAGAVTEATVSSSDAATQTFTLIVTWTRSVAATAISALAAEFANVVTIEAPDGGYRAPTPGKVTLVGGSDAVAVSSVAQSAIVLSTQ